MGKGMDTQSPIIWSDISIELDMHGARWAYGARQAWTRWAYTQSLVGLCRFNVQNPTNVGCRNLHTAPSIIYMHIINI